MKRVLFYLVFFLFSLSAAYSIGTAPDPDMTKAYWNFTSNTLDSTPNNFDLTNNGASATFQGIIGNAYTFGSADFMSVTGIPSALGTGDFTVSGWINISSLSTFARIWSLGKDNDNDDRCLVSIDGTGTMLSATCEMGVPESAFDGTTVLNTGQWYHIIAVFNNTNNTLNVYLNNSLEITATATGTAGAIAQNFFELSPENTGNGGVDGIYDEWSVFNYSLNSSDRAYLYQNGTPGIAQQWNFTEPLITTPQIQVNLTNGDFFNTTPISVAMTTTSIVNMSVYLNGSLYQTFLNTNSQLVSINITEGTNDLAFRSDDDNGFQWNNLSVVLDTVSPVIELITNQTEFNTFDINFSEVFNVTDIGSGIGSCIINVTELENVTTPDSFLANCTDTKTFTTAGLHNAFVLAIDNAGNENTFSWNFTINPFVLAFFNDTVNNSILLNYTSTIYHPDGRITDGTILANGATILSPVNNGSLDLGIHTVQFEKLGFATENFTINITETSGNESLIFNVTRSTIVLSIFDRETKELLTGLSTVTLVAPVGFNSTTTTGLLNISNINFVPGNYQIIVSHTNFTTESVFFTYNNQEILSVEVSLLNLTASQAGTVTVRAIADTGQLIQGAICRALEWTPELSSYVTRAEGLTDINGETLLNIELNTKLYKFSCAKSGITETTNQQIVSTNGAIIPITMPTGVDIPTPSLLQATGQLVNTTLNSTHRLITFTYSDGAGLVTEGCIKIYKKVGARLTLQTQTCSQSSQGEVFAIVNINQTYDIEVQGTLKQNDVTNKVDTILFKTERNLENALRSYGIDILIPLLFFFLGISLGFMLKPENIMISLFGGFVGVWGAQILVSSIVSQSIAIVISVVLTFILWGVNRR